MMMQPFRAQRQLLMSIPGFGALTAAKVISKIGTQVGEFFSTATHLASWAGLWAGLCPGNHELTGRGPLPPTQLRTIHVLGSWDPDITR
jgi:transposase